MSMTWSSATDPSIISQIHHGSDRWALDDFDSGYHLLMAEIVESSMKSACEICRAFIEFNDPEKEQQREAVI